MSKLHVIALISGGKDSLFSILHCLANGHDVVALANLHPDETAPDSGATENEDIDSHMYQTVGHTIVPLYAAALGIPLYREPIRGVAVNRAKSYGLANQSEDEATSTEQDETESLIPLLRRCKAAHPEANAISTGAILSSYQRTRVESVAIRLGLVPLSFLWQYPFLPPYSQSSLLKDMEAVGQDARIIKVASGGLGEDHLWMNVAQAANITRLTRDMARFGGGEVGAVLGEGGEYETLALDGPVPLWKNRIVVGEENLRRVNGDGGSAVLRISKSSLETKDHAGDNKTYLERLRIPPVWDTEFEAILKGSKRFQPPEIVSSEPGMKIEISRHAIQEVAQIRGQQIFLSNLASPGKGSAAAQMEAILTRLTSLLQVYSLGSAGIVFTMLLLRSMDDFSNINEAYSKFFVHPNPPARVTIACGENLSPGVEVLASFVATKMPRDQVQALHVQSRSYWAPANIGPYSQAIVVPLQLGLEAAARSELVHVAGQIPLIPATMQLISQDFDEQATLSLQHLWRIGRAMKVDWWTHAVVFITAESPGEARRRASKAGNLWRMALGMSAHDEDGDDQDTDISHASLYRSWATGENSAASDITPRSPLPAWKKVNRRTPDLDSPVSASIAIVQVAELPRHAAFEWYAAGISSDGGITVTGDYISGSCHGGGHKISLEMWDDGEFARTTAGDIVEIYTTTAGMKGFGGSARIIPCDRVFDASGNERSFAVVRHSVQVANMSHY